MPAVENVGLCPKCGSSIEPNCSFCFKARREVKKLVRASTGVCICDECVGLCIDLMGPPKESEDG